jgi:WD40 repeat protein
MDKIKILLFSSNPPGTDPLDLNREFREIDEEIRYGEYRDGLELIYLPGARPVDLLRKLNKERPEIVHFSGHGTDGSIFLEADEAEDPHGAKPLRSGRDMQHANVGGTLTDRPDDRSRPVSQLGLADVLRSCDSGNIQVVVLNACHSASLAGAIGETIDCVVSMSQEISDRAAIKFAASFYGALAFGRSVQSAFDQAVARLKAENTCEGLTPRLLVRQGVDARKLVLLAPRGPGVEAASPAREPPFTVPFPRNADFVGRDQDLDQLRSILSRQGPVGIRPSGLTGMGGIGKTQLAVEYAYRYRSLYPGGIFWVNAADPIVEGFAALGRRMRPESTDRSRDEQVRAAFEELRRTPESLLIVDNLAEPAELNRPVASACIPSALECRILFTTRRRVLGRFGAVELTVLLEEPALRLLLRHPARQAIVEPAHPEHEQARAICRMLGMLPLALELAGAFLGEWADIPLADYRERLKCEGPLSTLDDEAAEFTPVLLPAIHDAAVTATLSSQWDILQDEAARLLLRVASQFPESTTIPLARLGLLAGLAHHGLPGHPSALARAFKRLEDASLVEGLLEDQFRLHLLVRDYAIKKTPKEQLAGFRAWCASHVLEGYSRFSVLEENARSRGIDAMQEDLATALEFCPDGTEVYAGLELLLRLLQHEAHNLGEWKEPEYPALFAQQIHNRAVAMHLDSLALDAKNRLAELRRPYALLIWRASRESATLVRTMTGHRSWVNVVVFTPDGRHAVSGSDDHTLSLWDLRTGRELRAFVGHQGPVNAIVLTRDGRHALSGSTDQKIKLWDLGTGRELRTLSGHLGSVTAMAMTPDGLRAVSGSTDGTVRLWDLQTGLEVNTLSGHLGSVNSVAITADGRTALSACGDAAIRIWDLRTGHVDRVISNHAREVTKLLLTADCRHFISASLDKTLRLWSLQSGQELQTFAGDAVWIRDFAVTPDGRQVLCASDGCVLTLWELQTGAEVRRFFGHTGRINALDVSRDGCLALSGSDDLTIKLWNLRSEHDSTIDIGHGSRVNAVAITPDGTRAVSASSDQTLKLWDLATGRELQTFAGHSNIVTTLAITPNGRRVLSGSYDGLIKDWDIDTGEERQTLQGHEGGILALAITPDGNAVLSGSADRAIKIWDLTTGEELRTLRGHADRVTAVAVAADRRHALSSSDDGSVLWWDIAGDEPTRTLSDEIDRAKGLHRAEERAWGQTRGLCAHSDVVTTVALAPHGTRAVSGSSDRTLRLWDLGTGKCSSTLRGHLGRVNAAALTQDGRYAASISEDATLRLWDAEEGVCVLIIPLDSSPSALALASDDTTVVVGDGAGRLSCLRLVRP